MAAPNMPDPFFVDIVAVFPTKCMANKCSK